MTGARYLAALAAAAALLVPLFVAASIIRRRWLSALSGSIAKLAESVLVVAMLIGLGQLLGSVGEFRLGPLIAASVIVGACSLGLRRLPPNGNAPSTAPEPARVTRPDLAIVSTAIALTAFPFLSSTLRALDQGVAD